MVNINNINEIEIILNTVGKSLANGREIGFKISNAGLLDLHSIRGSADLLAFYKLYHDKSVHYEVLQSLENEEREILSSAEHARIEAIAMRSFTGIRQNITHNIKTYYNTIDATKQLSMPEIVRARLLKVWSGLDFNFSPNVTSNNDLNAYELEQVIYDQQGFALFIIEWIRGLKRELMQQSIDEISDNIPNENNELIDISNASTQQFKSTDQQNNRNLSNKEKVLQSQRNFIDEIFIPQFKEEYQAEYKIYTKQYDKVISASILATREEMQKLRNTLDEKLFEMRKAIQIKANKLLRKLMTKRLQRWRTETEDGVIDIRQLPNIIMHPVSNNIYKQLIDNNELNTTVSLLIDNSGSMRGKQISIAAMTADILSHTLEMCGIKNEVLGFTTSNWRGGDSYKTWLAEGKPNKPGRLSDLLHIVYKSANQPWRQARCNFALMLKENLLKENIDGEAILWAHQRLLKMPERRKVLIVISDGAPVDDATLSTNDPNYLQFHLEKVIKQVEKDKQVELIGIGIGHDLSGYYNKAVLISSANNLADTLFEQLSNLLTKC
jgi:cobaltochelatase CobT